MCGCIKNGLAKWYIPGKMERFDDPLWVGGSEVNE